MSGLRIVIVGHCHPDMPHVCAVRTRCFADALARRGHRVVLFSESLSRDAPPPPPADVRRDLARHDWSLPYRLGCPPRPAPLQERARRGALSAVPRKAAIAGFYLLRGGIFGDWVAGSQPYWSLLAEIFRPHVTWGTFGNTGAWTIARGVARLAGCPWVMDIKDRWESFIPFGLRRIVARRYRDAAALSVLSKAHGAEAARWFPAPPAVVYSGVAAALVAGPEAPAQDDTFPLTLSGSLYGDAHLETLAAGLAAWLENDVAPSERHRVTLAYYGSDGKRLGALTRRLDGLCRVHAHGFVPLPELHRALRRARLNMFVTCHQGLFHHKIFELLGAGRPVLCLPEAGAETRAIVDEVGGILHPCGDAGDIRKALAWVWAAAPAAAAIDRARLLRYSWESQAAILEGVLQRAAAAGGVRRKPGARRSPPCPPGSAA